MTGVTPQIAAMRAAREEFGDLTKGMSSELVRNIHQGTVPEEHRANSQVQRAQKVWERCQISLLIDDGTVDFTTRMA